MIAAKGELELLGILREQPRKGHGEIKPHGDRFLLGAEEPKKLLVGFLSAGPDERREMFEHRRFERNEAVFFVSAPDFFDDRVAGDHVAGQKVSEPLQGLGRDQLSVANGLGGHGALKK